MTHCDMCGVEIRVRDLKKVGKIKKCKKCYKEDRGCRRSETKNMRIRGKYADRNFKPYSTKNKPKRFHNLSMEEKQVLFKIFTTGKNKMDIDIAKTRINNLSTYQRYLFKKLNQKFESETQIGNRFKKEFEELTKT